MIVPWHIRQREQVETADEQQDQRKQRQQADPNDLFLLHQSDEVDDDGQCEGHRQPAMDLPNPLIPIQ
jgi:hypothetical protein